jgi:GNAT superfamily N-acetyltransferase
MGYLKDKLRKFGWRGFIAAACRLAWERTFRKDHYFLFSRTMETFKLPKPTTLSAVPINAQNTILFAPTFPYRPQIFLRRLSRGLHGFFYLREDGSPMAYHWYVLGRDYYETHYHWTFHLEKSEAYLFDGYLVPAGRGSAIAAQAFSHTYAAARELGVEKLFSVSEKNNAASWRFHLHLGFEIGACIEVTRIFTRALGARVVDARPHISDEMRATMNRHSRRGDPEEALISGHGCALPPGGKGHN